MLIGCLAVPISRIWISDRGWEAYWRRRTSIKSIAERVSRSIARTGAGGISPVEGIRSWCISIVEDAHAQERSMFSFLKSPQGVKKTLGFDFLRHFIFDLHLNSEAFFNSIKFLSCT